MKATIRTLLLGLVGLKPTLTNVYLEKNSPKVVRCPQIEHQDNGSQHSMMVVLSSVTFKTYPTGY